GDVWNMDFDYYNSDDSLIYASRDVAQDFLMYAPQQIATGSVEKGIMMMHKGDSAVFRAPADIFFREVRKMKKMPKFVKPGDLLTFHVRMKDIYDGKEYQRQIDEYNERMEAQELLILHDYVRNEGIKAQPSESGLYKIIKKEGTGSETAAGKTVTVHFVGSFIDGREFDNSYTRKEPFTFQLGKGKSIPGFEEGIASMRKGEICRLIIPSTLGYGTRGVRGRIPAFATLIFDVELLDIQ
nr:FKBP-type peptidyl-prolyl cis-trans isomerase [Bacteroidales bacterium]